MSQFNFLATLGLAPGRADSIRRLALRAFLTLLVINAAIAIAAIIGVSDGDDTQWRAVVTAASLVVAANAGAIERRRLGSTPLLSAIVACVGFAGVIWGIWDSNLESEWFWKTIGVFVTIGVTGTYVSMISLPRLRQPWIVRAPQPFATVQSAGARSKPAHLALNTRAQPAAPATRS